MNKKYAGMNFQGIACLTAFCFVFITNTTAQEVTGDYKIRTVVVDAGHGGKDPGSVGKKTNEKNVVLAIALKLGAYIEEQMPGIKVIYTRTTDEFIPLYERAEIANSNKADLFISIHANGNTNAEAYGTETLLLGYHRAGENFEVAKQENAVILLEEDYTTTYEGFDPNSPESYIMFSLMQERYFERSISFAALVQDQFRERARRKDRGVYRQGLLVLARTAMPGVLIETGFITNPDEEAYLMTSLGQDLIASAIFRAFRDYKNIVESKSSFAAASRTMELPMPVANGTSMKRIEAEQDGAIETGQNGTGEAGQDRINEANRDNMMSETGKATDIMQVPANILFKVQVTASSKSIPLNAPIFDGFEDVAEFHMDNLYKYAIGGSSTYEEIMTFNSKVKERFPDAFIIGIKDGQIIPLNQALKESQQIIHNN